MNPFLDVLLRTIAIAGGLVIVAFAVLCGMVAASRSRLGWMRLSNENRANSLYAAYLSALAVLELDSADVAPQHYGQLVKWMNAYMATNRIADKVTIDDVMIIHSAQVAPATNIADNLRKQWGGTPIRGGS